jgi:hypothetical protein
MGNGALGTQTNAGGTVVGPGKHSALCKAYKKAIKQWCKDGPGNRKPADFNSYVAKNLDLSKKAKDALLASRERTIGVIFKNNVVASLQALKDGGGKYAGAAATAIAAGAGGFPGGAGGAGGYRKDLSIEVRKAFGGALRPGRKDFPGTLHPDFTRPNGRPIEVKKPGEGESHPNQKKQYAQCSPDGTVEVVDCVQCDLPCKTWTSECGPKK